MEQRRAPVALALATAAAVAVVLLAMAAGGARGETIDITSNPLLACATPTVASGLTTAGQDDFAVGRDGFLYGADNTPLLLAQDEHSLYTFGSVTVKCADAACAQPAVRTEVEPVGGFMAAMLQPEAVAPGGLAVAVMQNRTGRFALMRCLTANCAAYAVSDMPAAFPSLGDSWSFDLAMLPNPTTGLPIVAIMRLNYFSLAITRAVYQCTDASCSDVTLVANNTDSAGSLSDSIISASEDQFTFFSDNKVQVWQCTDAQCTSYNVRSVVVPLPAEPLAQCSVVSGDGAVLVAVQARGSAPQLLTVPMDGSAELWAPLLPPPPQSATVRFARAEILQYRLRCGRYGTAQLPAFLYTAALQVDKVDLVTVGTHVALCYSPRCATGYPQAQLCGALRTFSTASVGNYAQELAMQPAGTGATTAGLPIALLRTTTAAAYALYACQAVNGDACCLRSATNSTTATVNGTSSCWPGVAQYGSGSDSNAGGSGGGGGGLLIPVGAVVGIILGGLCFMALVMIGFVLMAGFSWYAYRHGYQRIERQRRFSGGVELQEEPTATA